MDNYVYKHLIKILKAPELYINAIRSNHGVSLRTQPLEPESQVQSQVLPLTNCIPGRVNNCAMYQISKCYY